MLYRKYLFFLFLFASYQSYAQTSVNDLLSKELSVSDSLIILQKVDGRFKDISRIQAFFLTSNDCQTGYSATFETNVRDSSFPIEFSQPFMMSASEIFSAGEQVLGKDMMQPIHSILFRLVGDTGQFAEFLGSCQDQGINCCVAVNCSNVTRTCASQFDHGLQPFGEYILSDKINNPNDDKH
jgi:hypothetical protein